jgi:hypothetical protein
MRYLAHHRVFLNRKIKALLGETGNVEWIDSPPNGEWRALNFLKNDVELQEEWHNFWPAKDEQQAWSVVAWHHAQAVPDLLLMDASSSLEELKSSCGAREKGSLTQIRQAFERTKAALGVSADRDWERGHFGYAARLCALQFLHDRGIPPTRLIFIHFYGDQPGRGRTCPKSPDGWGPALRKQDEHLGLVGNWKLKDRVHRVYLPVVVPQE